MSVRVAQGGADRRALCVRTMALDELVAAIAGVLRDAGVGAETRLCCALSGGVDSVVLFEALRRLQPALGFALSAAHVHHGLSPHADAWAQACARRCAEAGVVLTRLDVAVERNHPQGLEAAARAARHRALETVDCDWLVFAHHQDDQAETLLFRLLRGSGVRGAAAMRAVVAGGDGRPGRLRPLLGVRRARIEAWARHRGLDWVEDESNAELHFARNAIRHRLLPVASELFPGAVPALARAAAHFAEAEDLLGELAAIDVAACGGPMLDRRSFLALAPARQANLLRWLLQRRGQPAPAQAVLDEALRQLRACALEDALQLPLGALACCAYRNAMWLEPQAAPLPARQRWQGEPLIVWGNAAVRFESAVGQGLDRARLECAAELWLGARKDGMRLQVAPGRPRRPLRKLCQEAAIPEWLRDRLPVLWVDDEPAWVGGIGIDAAFACPAGEAGILPRWQPASAA